MTRSYDIALSYNKTMLLFVRLVGSTITEKPNVIESMFCDPSLNQWLTFKILNLSHLTVAHLQPCRFLYIIFYLWHFYSK